MERPVTPWRSDAPSVWFTEALQLLVKHPAVGRLDFYQGDLGNHAPKPATFLVARLPDLQR
eukprot:9230344-Lingulodinium_polyedra.AAC.1